MSTENQAAPQAPEATIADAEVSMQQVEDLLRADEAAETGLPDEEEVSETPQDSVPEMAEPAADPNADPLDNPKGDLRVPLREERERRRAAEQRIEQLAQHQRLLAGYLEQLGKQVAPQQQEAEAPPVPDFDVDPAGHLRHQVDTLKSVLGQMSQHQRAQAEAQQVAQQQQAATQAVTYTEAEFAKKTPDYYEAVDYMRDKLARRFSVLGVPKDQIPTAVGRDLQQFGLRALRAGMNPAEKLFQLAKEEGYNGPRVADAERLSTIAKGAAATRGARSSAPASNGEMTLQEAAKLSYKDLSKMSESQWAKLMGGA